MSTKRYINYFLSFVLLFATTFGVYHSSEHLAAHEHQIVGLGGYDFVYAHSGNHTEFDGLGESLDSFCGICSLLSSADLWAPSSSHCSAFPLTVQTPRASVESKESLKLPYFCSRAPPSIA